MKKETLVNASEIEKLLKEDCEENKMKFSYEKFSEFFNFLEIDFYDWVKDNLRQFKSN